MRQAFARAGTASPSPNKLAIQMIGRLLRQLLRSAMGPDREDLENGFRIWIPASSRMEALAYTEGGRHLLAEISSRAGARTTLHLDGLSWLDGDPEHPLPDDGRKPLTNEELDRVVPRLQAFLARRGDVRLELF